jgi:ABC-2 type transport system permease protein
VSTEAVTPRRVLRAEWIKLATLRSTVIAFVVAFGGMIAIGALISWITVTDWASMTLAERDAIEVSPRVLPGRQFAQLAVGVLGVLAIGGEYATGMIRATFAAVPRRLPVLWAKLGVFSALTFVLMTVAAFASFYVGTAILSAHWGFGISEPGVLRAVLMVGVDLVAVCMLGIAFGFILRSTAGAIATLFGILMVLPIIGEFAPKVGEYLPTGAMSSLVTPTPQEYVLAPWPALGLLCAYVGLAIVAAGISLTRRDV